MDFRQLRYFLAVAEAGQITAAADKLHIAQPPLSYQMKLLETELGVKLFVRGPHGVTLTGSGELLRKRAEQLLELAASSKKEVMNYGGGLCGVLPIGAISSSGGVLPNAQMIQFVRSHPNIQLDIHEGNTYAVIEMLEKGLIELGIVRTPFPHKSLCCRYAAEEPMVAVMTEENTCGHAPDTVTLEELSYAPLICYRRFEALIGEAFAKIGLDPTLLCKNDDARTTIFWAHAGLGVGLVPRSAALAYPCAGLSFKTVICDELMTRPAIVWVRERYLSAAAQKFIELFGV